MKNSTDLQDPKSVDFSQLDASANVTDLLVARLGDSRTALRFEGDEWTWDQYVHESWARAQWLTSIRGEGPFHVGVLLDNVPDFCFLLGAAALSGAVLVGLNPTRRGAELGRDIEISDCQIVITESKYLDGLATVLGPDRVFDIDAPEYCAGLDPFRHGAPRAMTAASGTDLMMLIFTSGTSGDPKAVRVTHRKIAGVGVGMVQLGRIRRDDVAYLAMPIFHSGCIMAGWAPALAAGATIVLKRRFSASGFLPDVREHAVTYFHYVGKPLAYILATAEHDDDRDNTLRIALGNEAADHDIGRFAQRFGCAVVDSFGSTEGGVYLTRTDDTPPTSIGAPGDGVEILDPATGEPAPTAEFSEGGQLLNAEEAIGEIVNLAGAGAFDGYYKNDAADADRMRDGIYWSGDLAYRDEAGYYYFAGRTIEWLRVDGENLAAAPVERVLMRHPAVSVVAVYAVPAPDVGDQVMATVTLAEGQHFDAHDFVEFLRAQPDLGTKWTPRFVRVTAAMPMTATNKVLKRSLAQEKWMTDDDVWWQEDVRADLGYRLMTDADRSNLRDEFQRNGKAHVVA